MYGFIPMVRLIQPCISPWQGPTIGMKASSNDPQVASNMTSRSPVNMTSRSPVMAQCLHPWLAPWRESKSSKEDSFKKRFYFQQTGFKISIHTTPLCTTSGEWEGVIPNFPVPTTLDQVKPISVFEIPVATHVTRERQFPCLGSFVSSSWTLTHWHV